MLPDDEYYPALLRTYHRDVEQEEEECKYYFGDIRITEKQFYSWDYMTEMVMRSLAKEYKEFKKSKRWKK